MSIKNSFSVSDGNVSTTTATTIGIIGSGSGVGASNRTSKALSSTSNIDIIKRNENNFNNSLKQNLNIPKQQILSPSQTKTNISQINNVPSNSSGGSNGSHSTKVTTSNILNYNNTPPISASPTNQPHHHQHHHHQQPEAKKKNLLGRLMQQLPSKSSSTSSFTPSRIAYSISSTIFKDSAASNAASAAASINQEQDKNENSDILKMRDQKILSGTISKQLFTKSRQLIGQNLSKFFGEDDHSRFIREIQGPYSLPVVVLPRGGVYISASPQIDIQIGIPPETIKDTLRDGLKLPSFYIVPRERFHKTAGITLTEIEFPAFYNFFILNRPVTLVARKDCVDQLMIILREALDGPIKENLFLHEEYTEFISDELKSSLPDFEKEIAFFREPRPPNYTKIEVESLVKFVIFDEITNECTLPGTDIQVLDTGNGFRIFNSDNGKEAFIPDEIAQSISTKPLDELFIDNSSPATESLSETSFSIPQFGVTILGNSHGFDKSGSTSGFVLWINGQGVMVDPPPHSNEMLKRYGIPSKGISAVILTHCHADHDAGTFQKLINEGKIMLLTTKTIFESFLRKYSAVANLHVDFLRQLVTFRPVLLDEPTYLFGAKIKFFYAFHAIPCVGFEAISKSGTRISFSGDTFYDPNGLDAICPRIISEKRKKALLNFPFDANLVLHEAGVAPIHTPVQSLALLPEKLKKNIRLLHIDGKKSKEAEALGLQIANLGVNNTIILEESTFSFNSPKLDSQILNQMQILYVLSSVDLLKSLSSSDLIELSIACSQKQYLQGEILKSTSIQTNGIIVIASGEVAYTRQGVKSILGFADYFGEYQTLMGKSLTGVMATAESKVVNTIFIERSLVHHLMEIDSQLKQKLLNVVAWRTDENFVSIEYNSILSMLTNAQRTQLLSISVYRTIKKGEKLFKSGEPCSHAFLICDGEFIFDEIHGSDYQARMQNKHNSDSSDPANPKKSSNSSDGFQRIASSGRAEPPTSNGSGGIGKIFRAISKKSVSEFMSTSDNNTKGSSILETSMKSISRGSSKLSPFSPLNSETEPKSLPDPLIRGAFICDMLGIQNDLYYTLSLTCISQTASVFFINKDDISAFLDENPVILLSLLKSILII